MVDWAVKNQLSIYLSSFFVPIFRSFLFTLSVFAGESFVKSGEVALIETSVVDWALNKIEYIFIYLGLERERKSFIV